MKRARLLGHIATSWARGTTFCPPGSNIDLTWPLISFLAKSMGAHPAPFFEGIAQREADRIVKTLGQCRANWRIEGEVIDRMRRLLPKVKTHRHEWQSMIRMTRVLMLHRRAEFAVSEVEFFHAADRLVDTEWTRRLADQRAILRDIAALRREVRVHFSRRYHGDAFEEWIRDLFDLHERKIKDCVRISGERLNASRRVYAIVPFRVMFRGVQWPFGSIQSMYFPKLAFDHGIVKDDEVLLS